MKGLMKTHKSQVKSVYRFEALEDWQFFDHEFLRNVGYTNYEVFLVGAAGGNSGQCTGTNSDAIAYRANGGGGGSLLMAGLLKDLPTNVGIWVGSVGADGADTGDNVKAGTGSPGGDTIFGAFVANGGEGGIGGRVDVVSGGTANIIRSMGGKGGGNNQGVGAGGQGGNVVNDDAPHPGTWGGSGNIQGGGGGGGGQGRLKPVGGGSLWVAMSGGDGAQGGTVHGQPTVSVAQSSSNHGGGGGGVSIRGLTGVYELHGTKATGANPNGIVVVQVS